MTNSMRTPLVTIITVCRNSARTIERTIESVLHQSYRRIEYIIVDGGSEDDTMAVVRRYEKSFKGRLKAHSGKDKGIYDAMNRGILLARGDIVGIINSDDWYEPDAVTSIVEGWKMHGEGVYYGILRVLEDGQEVMLSSINHRFLHREHIGHPAYFVARSLYERHGTFRLEYRYAADYEFMLRLLALGAPFFQINSILANFNQGGATWKHGAETYEEYVRIRQRYGYLTRTGMLVRVYRNRLGRLIEQIR